MIFGLLTGPLFFNTQQVPQGVKKALLGAKKCIGILPGDGTQWDVYGIMRLS